MRKLSAIALALVGTLSLFSCSHKETGQDTSPITILVSNVREDNFKLLAKHLKEEFDIDVEFVYEMSSDKSDQITLDFANCNNQADMIFTAGTQGVEPFMEKSGYFKKWVDNGLFNSFYDREGGVTVRTFAPTRALFAFDLANDNYQGYQGPQLDENGKPTGKMLNDVHKVMPWISEDGSNNCFTMYDNLWVMLDKGLLAPDKADKFQKAIKIAEEISKSCIFTFDYAAGFETIFKALDASRQEGADNVLGTVEEFLDFEHTAKVEAVSAALALQRELYDRGRNEAVQAALVPYTRQRKDMQPWRSATVCG